MNGNGDAPAARIPEQLTRRLVDLSRETGEVLRAMIVVHQHLDALRQRQAQRPWTSAELERYLALSREDHRLHRRYEVARRRCDALRGWLVDRAS